MSSLKVPSRYQFFAVLLPAVLTPILGTSIIAYAVEGAALGKLWLWIVLSYALPLGVVLGRMRSKCDSVRLGAVLVSALLLWSSVAVGVVCMAIGVEAAEQVGEGLALVAVPVAVVDRLHALWVWRG